ncbi:hypothetical protein [Pontibacter beigongshangensis]|uniref:hypothetical protein n=1 Tax=Pontibacter beigongshangensis TaxID=2574733 RepID=UPI00164F30C0|nr:hypothetical protein [Pontibacter beigongshangensis]
MKLKITKNLFAAFLIAVGTTGSVFAQNEPRTYELKPNEIPPSAEGYYNAGVMKDGVNHKGCGAGENQNVTEHSASSHNENGAYGGFTFEHVSVMPNCNGKGTPEFGLESLRGYVQLREFDGAQWAAYAAGTPGEYTISNITSPQVTAIKSLTIIAGSDLSINADRSVTFAIEASEDNGATWEMYVMQSLAQQGASTYTFTAGGDNPGFNEVATLSATKPVMIRIIPWQGPLKNDNRGQRLKVFSLALEATGPAVTSSKEEIAKNEPFFNVQENTFVALKENLRVYNMVGALVGSGKNVKVSGGGLYIVRSDSGLSKKVFLQ